MVINLYAVIYLISQELMGPNGDIEGFDDNGKVVGAVCTEIALQARLHADCERMFA